MVQPDARHGDMADQATENHLIYLDLEVGPIVAQRRNELGFIEANGVPPERPCIDCGDSIPKNRRTAKPFAVRCKDCEETVERSRSQR